MSVPFKKFFFEVPREKNVVSRLGEGCSDRTTQTFICSLGGEVFAIIAVVVVDFFFVVSSLWFCCCDSGGDASDLASLRNPSVPQIFPLVTFVKIDPVPQRTSSFAPFDFPGAADFFRFGVRFRPAAGVAVPAGAEAIVAANLRFNIVGFFVATGVRVAKRRYVSIAASVDEVIVRLCAAAAVVAVIARVDVATAAEILPRVVSVVAAAFRL